MNGTKLFFALTIASALFMVVGCTNSGKPAAGEKRSKIIKVPSQISTIAAAVKTARSGDTIVIAPGIYFENSIDIDKAVTITSEWKFTADEVVREKTVIDGGDNILFNILVPGVEISGLRIINADHALTILAKTKITHNHLSGCKDALSFETSGGGYAGYNVIENDRDDGIDIDIGSDKDKIGCDITIENNTIINSYDDGIEIRLFAWPNQNIIYNIRQNSIVGSNNAAVQLISYDVPTGKKFYIHHNIFRNCKTGLGCMEGANTREDLSGASKMDEEVFLYNNTLVYNEMGATGGNNIKAFNNVVIYNSLGGFKKFGNKSVVSGNLFFNNGGNHYKSFSSAVIKENNLFSVNPRLDKKTFKPETASPCVDGGIKQFKLNGKTLFNVPVKYIVNSKTGIGAFGVVVENNPPAVSKSLIVDAGKNIVLKYPGNKTELRGKVVVAGAPVVSTEWKPAKEGAEVKMVNSDAKSTEVFFEKTGIYKFKFICKTGDEVATDNVTVRYVDGGNGDKQFINKENKYSVNAVDFAYSYGNASVVADKKYVRIAAETSVLHPVLEYFVGTAENKKCTLRFHLKNQDSAPAKFFISFNSKVSESASIGGNSNWEWVEVSPQFDVTAGLWPLLIYQEKGELLIDKIEFVF